MSELESSFQEIYNEYSQLKFGLNETMKRIKSVERSSIREIEKQRHKLLQMKKKNSGFSKPLSISNQLCDFLKIPRGSLLSRSEVTKHIDFYIKEHDLLHETDKRIILPDKRLSYLLGCKKTDKVTYFNLQHWLKHHYIKPYTDGEGEPLEEE